MTVMYKVTTEWTGFVGAPGYTNFFFETTDPLADGAAEAAVATRQFWDTLKDYFNTATHLRVIPEVATMNDEDGSLEDLIPVASPPAEVVGTSTAGIASPSGFLVKWRTNVVVGGKRITGRTFLVPGATNQFDPDGTVKAAAITAIAGAGNALIANADTNFGVWHRPVAGAGGLFCVAASASCPDKAVYLSSRRD